MLFIANLTGDLNQVVSCTGFLLSVLELPGASFPHLEPIQHASVGPGQVDERVDGCVFPLAKTAQTDVFSSEF